MAAVQPCGGVPTCQCVLRPGEDHEGAEESISIINKPNPESLVVLGTVYIFPLYSSFQSITLSPENLGKRISRVQGHIAKKWLGQGLSCLLCFFLLCHFKVSSRIFRLPGVPVTPWLSRLVVASARALLSSHLPGPSMGIPTHASPLV